MQVVLTTIEPSKTRQDLSYDAYEYTVLSLPLLFQKTRVLDLTYALGMPCCPKPSRLQILIHY